MRLKIDIVCLRHGAPDPRGDPLQQGLNIVRRQAILDVNLAGHQQASHAKSHRQQFSDRYDLGEPFNRAADLLLVPRGGGSAEKQIPRLETQNKCHGDENDADQDGRQPVEQGVSR